jgi:hypothetical protein
MFLVVAVIACPSRSIFFAAVAPRIHLFRDRLAGAAWAHQALSGRLCSLSFRQSNNNYSSYIPPKRSNDAEEEPLIPADRQEAQQRNRKIKQVQQKNTPASFEMLAVHAENNGRMGRGQYPA